MTYLDMIDRIVDKYPWSARWWHLKEVVVSNGQRAWSVRDVAEEAGNDLQAMGCTGQGSDGLWRHAFWDLDVGHGTDGYTDLNLAIFAAKRLCRFLDGYREIRKSKSGNGVHVRQQFKAPLPPDFPIADYCKDWARKVELRVDASPLGRQVAWLWTRPPQAAGAFEEVESYEEVFE